MNQGENIEASRQFVQWLQAGGIPNQMVENRRQAIDHAIEEQKEEVFEQLQESLENFRNQARPILEQLGALRPFEQQIQQIGALERKMKELEDVQKQLLKAIQEKSDQVEALKQAVYRLTNELNSLQSNGSHHRFASHERALLEGGNYVCHGLMQKGVKII